MRSYKQNQYLAREVYKFQNEIFSSTVLYNFRRFSNLEHIFLIDTCCIDSTQESKNPIFFKNISDKLTAYSQSELSLRVLYENLDNFLVYFTPKISDEFGEFKSSRYRKNQKMKSGKDNLERELVFLRRGIKEYADLKKTFRKAIWEKDLIFKRNLGHWLLHEFYLEKYDFFKEKYGLSETDLDLLLLGGVISKLEGKSAIISNDIPLSDAWAEFFNRENFGRGNFEFFQRTKTDNFRRLLCVKNN